MSKILGGDLVTNTSYLTRVTAVPANQGVLGYCICREGERMVVTKRPRSYSTGTAENINPRPEGLGSPLLHKEESC